MLRFKIILTQNTLNVKIVKPAKIHYYYYYYYYDYYLKAKKIKIRYELWYNKSNKGLNKDFRKICLNYVKDFLINT